MILMNGMKGVFSWQLDIFWHISDMQQRYVSMSIVNDCYYEAVESIIKS